MYNNDSNDVDDDDEPRLVVVCPKAGILLLSFCEAATMWSGAVVALLRTKGEVCRTRRAADGCSGRGIGSKEKIMWVDGKM